MSDTRTTKKAQTRAAILESAQRSLRAKGVDGTSVAGVMQGAGLTVGGFYAHFPSKEALIEAALETAMDDLRQAIAQGPEGPERLRESLRQYLSRRHRDDRERGCPLPAVASDIEAGSAQLEQALARELERHAELLAEGRTRTEALGALCLMVGGLTLARAVADTPLSDELLAAARAFGERALQT